MVVAAAAAAALFFILWWMLQAEESPWVPAGLAASVVMLVAAFARLLVASRDRLVRQVPHALCEVDDPEQERETTALGRLERIQPPQAAEHRAIIV
jgi:hypothetical protein